MVPIPKPGIGHSPNLQFSLFFCFRLQLGTTPICKPAAAEGRTNLSPRFWSHVLYEPPTSDKTDIVLCQTLSILLYIYFENIKGQSSPMSV